MSLGIVYGILSDDKSPIWFLRTYMAFGDKSMKMALEGQLEIIMGNGVKGA